MTKDEPKTVAALLACDELPKFSQLTLVITEENYRHGYVEYDGAKIKFSGKVGDVLHIPLPGRGFVTPLGPDSIYCATDSEGNTWRPVYDGEYWYKQRFYL